MTARRLGENNQSQCSIPLNAGLIILVCYAIPLTVMMIGYATIILGLFSSDSEGIHLAAEWCLNLITMGEGGTPWDFNKAERKEAALNKIYKDEPIFNLCLRCARISAQS